MLYSYIAASYKQPFDLRKDSAGIPGPAGTGKADTTMSRFRKPLLFFCDSLILLGVTLVLSRFSLRYGLSDAVGRGLLLKHLLVLYACTAVFQMLFHTYDSLWRYAESREYLFLLAAAFCGFLAYEVISRALMGGVISFILLVAIACLWVLGMMRFLRGFAAYVARTKA